MMRMLLAIPDFRQRASHSSDEAGGGTPCMSSGTVGVDPKTNLVFGE
jgi:hypothetical protein